MRKCSKGGNCDFWTDDTSQERCIKCKRLQIA